jgi:hypothetical protein
VIQIVDFVEVAGMLPLHLIDPDLQTKPFRILWRLESDLPQREEIGEG